MPISEVMLEQLGPHDEWALPIGRFMVAFAGCESFTHSILGVLGSPHLREACRTMDLKPRLAIVRALIAEIEPEPKLARRIEKALAEMTVLMTKRNLIAHNEPIADIYFHKKTGELHVERKVRSQRDSSKFVTLSELRVLLKRVQALQEQLADILFLLQFPENRGVKKGQ